MDGMTWLWILIAVVAVVVIVALVLGARRNQTRRVERHREQAHELRDEASTAAVKAERDEAAARETDAKARKARAEADQKAAEAVRLETVAKEQGGVAAQARADVDDKHRRADELDPDVTAAATAADGTTESGPAEDPRVTPTAPGTPAPTAYRDHTEDGTTTPPAETRTPDRDEQNGSASAGKHAAGPPDPAEVDERTTRPGQTRKS